MYRMGIDAGSKTLKLVLLDETGKSVFSTYIRHRANIARTLEEVIHDLNWRMGPFDATIAMTGSGAIDVAKELGVPFVQEVVATTHAVREKIPQADVVIELGGEDAKIIYLTDGLEQRMNATCAGGTGGFIDTIAHMLDVGSPRMSRLAFGHTNIYPIASRCAVFAQTDVRPLLNAGVSKSDIAASAFDAVVRQTLSGLACGRPIKGNVVFLGGPLEHMPYLVTTFRQALGINSSQGIKPQDAHLFTVTGIALLSDDELRLGTKPAQINSAELLERIENLEQLESDLEFLSPLFENEEELSDFRVRHARVEYPRKSFYSAEGPLYLGIDAGSTTLKIAVLNEDAELVYSAYQLIQGDLVQTLRKELLALYRKLMPPSYLPKAKASAWIERVCATGYGEDLLRAALGVDMGMVETAAHLRAARQVCPDLDFLLDIGGQDMKALWVKDGIVVDAALNEACSSGCGAFVEGTAAALKTTPHNFAQDALLAKHPIDLGTKCTVFMSSRVKHAQKVGAPIEDIAAGVAYSVVKNALHRIIGEDRAPKQGDKVVVQGGTFESDAVLRAFERVTDTEVVRPVQSRIMGAIGCALTARDSARSIKAHSNDIEDLRSSLISYDELEKLKVDRQRITCTGCANACKLSVVSFDEDKTRYFISDNKCERGLDEITRRNGGAQQKSDETLVHNKRAYLSDANTPPNLVALEQKLFGAFADVEQDTSRGGISIGLLDSMALYAYRPFWHTLITQLGYSIKLPEAGCENNRMSEAWETIPSESVCYPAKTTHVRYFNLCEKECDAVFFPSFERNYHCPVQTQYANVLASNVQSTRTHTKLAPFMSPQLNNYKPQRFMSDDVSLKQLLDSFNICIHAYNQEQQSEPVVPEISKGEFIYALQMALQAQNQITAQLEQATHDALDWLHADPHRHGIVLAGRPYHMDEALLHGIDEELVRLGFAVFGAAGLSSLAAAKKNRGAEGAYPFIPAKRLVRLARLIAEQPQLDAVFLGSFGCGFEAMSLKEAAAVLDNAHKPCTTLKIDDMSDLAHIRIRLRTLAAAIELRQISDGEKSPSSITDTSASKAHADVSIHEDIYTEVPQSVTEHTSASPTKTTTFSLLESMHDEPLNTKDLECSRQACVKDVCFTANAMAARIIRALRKNPSITRVELPFVCENCLTEAIPRIVEHACGCTPEYIWVPWESFEVTTQSAQQENTATFTHKPRIGILGNPLLCFEPFMNEGIIEMLEDLGCEVVMPKPELVACEDVRYIDQLKVYEQVGITDVIYLLSFGCLKGHTHARGALRELREMFPNIRITVIDYDPESSALNRENRIRLAVENAREALLTQEDACSKQEVDLCFNLLTQEA